MEIAFKFIGGVITTAAGCTVLHMLVAAKFFPTWLENLSNRLNDRDASSWVKARLGLYLLLAGFGFSAVGYVSTTAALWWMPGSWGFVDDDGRYSTVANSLGALVAVLAMVGLPALLLKFADYEVRELRRRKRDSRIGGQD